MVVNINIKNYYIQDAEKDDRQLPQIIFCISINR
jgi:hypothetical protein